MTWLWILLAVAYILSPYDLIPDFIPIKGWIDDGVVLVFLYRYIAKLLARRRYAATNQKSQSSYDRESSQTDRNGHQQTDTNSPYEVLGVAPTATPKEIHKAYLKLVNQYHPDKVAHLGPEFQELADRKFKEIQQAYQSLKK